MSIDEVYSNFQNNNYSGFEELKKLTQKNNLEFSNKNMDEEYIRFQNNHCRGLLDELEKLIQKEELEFLNNELYFEPMLPTVPDISKLHRAHQIFTFYTNENIIEKLKKEFGSFTELFKWFILLDQIKAQFETFAKEGVLVQEFFVLQLIRTHLILKFERDFSDCITKREKNGIDIRSLMLHEYHNFKDRLTYRSSGKGTKKKADDAEVENYLQKKSLKGDTLLWTFVREEKSIKGNTTEIIKNIVNQCMYYDKSKKSPSSFYRLVYDFFKLIMQDEFFPDEQEFANNAFQCKTYNGYKAYRVRQILNRK